MNGAEIKAMLGKCDNAHSCYDIMIQPAYFDLSSTGQAFTF